MPKRNLAVDAISLSGSAPNISSSDSENVFVRKRKRDDQASMNDFMEEIRNMLNESTQQNKTKLSSLESKMAELIDQNSNIIASIDYVSKKYDELHARMDEVVQERKADRLYIQQLENKVDNLERSLYSTRLEVKNVPKIENENKENLCDIIIKTGSVIGAPIQHQDIKDVFRTKGKFDKAGTIVVDFVSAVKRDKIVKKTREYNRNNSGNKINTKHLSLEGSERPVFISESLSPRNHYLYRLARNFASEYAYKYCWIKNGKIYLRRETSECYVRVDSEEVLSKLRMEK